MPILHKRRFVDAQGSNLTSSTRPRLESATINWRADLPWNQPSGTSALPQTARQQFTSPLTRNVKKFIPSQISKKIPFNPTQPLSDNPILFSSSIHPPGARLNPFSTPSVGLFSSSFSRPTHVFNDGSSILAASRQVFKSDRAGDSNSKHVSTMFQIILSSSPSLLSMVSETCYGYIMDSYNSFLTTPNHLFYPPPSSPHPSYTLYTTYNTSIPFISIFLIYSNPTEISSLSTPATEISVRAEAWF